MIDFEIPESIQTQAAMSRQMAAQVMRPAARRLDEHEGEKPWDYINLTWPFVQSQTAASLERAARQRAPAESSERKPSYFCRTLVHMVEMLAWGDMGIYLCTPGGRLGETALFSAGTPEQQERFLRRFTTGEPKWGAMAITEPGAGSDIAAIQTAAALDPAANEWVLNGEKIFVTNGLMAAQETEGFVVVWATVDRAAGRAGIKPFVVERGTPGMKVVKVERKLGIRASDTAAIVFQDCRVPYANMLGSAEVQDRRHGEGFKRVLAAFDVSRPVVAAAAIGIGRAALELGREKLAEQGIEIQYDRPAHRLLAVQRDVLEMESRLHAAWLLTLRAAWLVDMGRPNALEASMAKAAAGRVVTWVTQKGVELLGPPGYSCKLLAEKWMRDAKITDLFEGTGQINTLIVARHILGYTRHELK